MRQGLASYFRYHRLLNDRSAFRLLERGAASTFAFDVPPGSRTCKRFHTELTLTGLFRLVQYFGDGAGVHHVSFQHDRPDHAGEYERIFQGCERFEQSTAGVTFDSAILDRPRIFEDRQVHAMLETLAQERVTRLVGQTPLRDRVLQYLLEHATIEQEMSSAARSLGMSVRTLRRRLQDEGENYSELSKQALASRATRLVTDADRTLDEAAYLLGFSHRSAFQRAFKRWTGMTPNEYRRHGARPEPRPERPKGPNGYNLAATERGDPR